MLTLIALAMIAQPPAPPAPWDFEARFATLESRVFALESKCASCPCATPELQGKPHDKANGPQLCACVPAGGKCPCGPACCCANCTCKDGECLKAQPKKVEKPKTDYPTVEGTIIGGRLATEKGPNVIAIALQRSDGQPWTYFFPFKDDACCVDGTIQNGVLASSVANTCARYRLKAKLYLDPDNGHCVAGLHLFGYQDARKAEPQAQSPPAYSYAPPVQSSPMMVFSGGFGGFGGVGGGCSGGR